MDAFESIVATYLDSKGYWVKQSVKVNISKDDKKELGLQTMPTPEIDLVAYNPVENELILIEVKSYFDSEGVTIAGLNDPKSKKTKRYRLLNDEKYQRIIREQLQKIFIDKKFINHSTKIKYALAAGNVRTRDYDKIKAYLAGREYVFYEPMEIAKAIKSLKNSVYINDSVTITVKLLREYLKDDNLYFYLIAV